MAGRRPTARGHRRRSAGGRGLRIAVVALLAIAALLVLTLAAADLLASRSTFARAVAWRESDIEDRHRFPSRVIRRAGPVAPLPEGPEAARIGHVVPDESLVGVPLDEFLADRATRAFLVVHQGRIVYERYFNGGSRDRRETSFSMAKSFTSTLVGIAIDEGAIRGVDDPVTRYLPELARRDPRFERIRIRDLLTMSSGLRYEEEGLPWSDDAVTYYGVDLREVALERTGVERPPNQQWRYNNFHPLLLGLILERATGQRVADYMASRLWQPLGAEADASWSLDSERSGFEKMESGVNARARDFARFGELFRQEGRYNGRRIVSRDWVGRATSGRALGDPADFYGAMWWVDAQPGARRQPFFARGKYGQVIAVVPDEDLVVVRLGADDAGVDWQELILDIAHRVGGGS